MTFPLVVLAILSVVGGLINLPEALGGHHALANFLAPIYSGSAIENYALQLSHETEYILMAVSAVIAIGVALYAYRQYAAKNSIPTEDATTKGLLYNLSYHKLYIDEFYDTLIVKPLKWLSNFLYTYVEKLGIDGFVNGIASFFVGSGKGVRQLQSGYVGFYILMMVLGIMAVLIYGIITI